MSTPEAAPRGCDSDDLQRLFNALFLATENTELIGGGDEPIYYPADAAHPHARLVFRADYARSALHEIAHWCIAGPVRRRAVDYGYWYRPDGRNALEQAEFEQVEARPQALEWLLSDAAGIAFRPSVDNLHGDMPDLEPFVHAICAEAARYCREGLPPRAARLHAALRAACGGSAPEAGRYVAARLLGTA